MIGIDEVGRGCWAGPLLVVAARKIGDLPKAVTDSKKLSRKSRKSLIFDLELSCEFGEGWVMAAEIDELGLTKSMHLGVSRALGALDARFDEDIVIDGDINYCPAEYIAVSTLIGGDAINKLVGAASVYAKVKRDQFMTDLKGSYSIYEFDKHVGYGTALHRQLLSLHGVSDQHRLSFKPIKSML